MQADTFREFLVNKVSLLGEVGIGMTDIGRNFLSIVKRRKR